MQECSRCCDYDASCNILFLKRKTVSISIFPHQLPAYYSCVISCSEFVIMEEDAADIMCALWWFDSFDDMNSNSNIPNSFTYQIFQAKVILLSFMQSSIIQTLFRICWFQVLRALHLKIISDGKPSYCAQLMLLFPQPPLSFKRSHACMLWSPPTLHPSATSSLQHPLLSFLTPLVLCRRSIPTDDGHSCFYKTRIAAVHWGHGREEKVGKVNGWGGSWLCSTLDNPWERLRGCFVGVHKACGPDSASFVCGGELFCVEEKMFRSHVLVWQWLPTVRTAWNNILT